MKILKLIATTATVFGTSIAFSAAAQSKVINVPCVDGGGSAGWSHQSGTLPDRYYPMVLLDVSQMKPGQYPKHPMYYGKKDYRTKYGYCAYSTSSD